MNDRRVLTWAADEHHAELRRDWYKDNGTPSAEAEQVGGRWAVTAAKKKEGR